MWGHLRETITYCLLGSKDEEHLWPTEHPKFSACLRGQGKSERVRIAEHGDPATGIGEELVLESDIDPRCCSNCLGPVGILLALMGE